MTHSKKREDFFVLLRKNVCHKVQIISVPNMIYVLFSEMFEHMKNYEKLLGKVAKWLQPGGKLFVHIFTHKQFAYHFNKGKIKKDL